jgi:two-component system, sensor histidine kinase and response regulator
MTENCANPLQAGVKDLRSGAQETGLDGVHDAPRLAAPRISSAPESLHVLVAEDNAVNQQIARRLLEKRGHTVVVVGDGRAAIDQLQREAFDLVLMDVQMPVMDGVEATAAIRARERQTGAWLPVVAMTAHAMKGDREKYLAAGMDGYVSKPVQKEALWEVVEEFGRKKRLKAQAASDTCKTPMSEDPLGQGGVTPADSNASFEYAVFDCNAALERVEGDSDLLREMASIFLENCDAMLDDLRRACASGDPRSLERAAHALKGCLANLAANEAWQSAAHVEKLSRENDFNGVAGACAQLERAVEKLRPAMDALLEPVAC